MTSTPTGARQNYDPSETTQLRVPSHRTGSFRRIKKSLPRYDYEHYSRLAGPLTQPDPDQAVQGAVPLACSRRSRTASAPR